MVVWSRSRRGQVREREGRALRGEAERLAEEGAPGCAAGSGSRPTGAGRPVRRIPWRGRRAPVAPHTGAGLEALPGSGGQAS